MLQPKPPALQAFNPDNIPDSLKANARWAPWKAVWSEKRQKYDKIPHLCTAPHYGISTAKPERWGTFDQALKAHASNPGLFAGLGYVMTNAHGVIAIDLDNCVRDNTIADWAQEIIDQACSYTELSPSGKGLRVMALGEIPNDWTNHEVGIEVYAGHQPRFLTITGSRLKASVPGLSQPDVFADLSARYAKSKTAASVISMQLPDILDEMVLPAVGDLGLSHSVEGFLLGGEHRGDRSRALFAAAIGLYNAGLSDAEVFSMLALNPFTMEVALDHRRQDHDRALMYLWIEACQKGRAKSTPVAGLADFEVLATRGRELPTLTMPVGAQGVCAVASADDFDVVGESAPIPKKPVSAVRTPTVLDWLELPEDPPEPKFVIPGWMPDNVVTLFAAHGGTGKSFMSLYIGLCLATGRHPFAKGVTIPRVKVVLYSAEDNMAVMSHRLAKYIRLLGISRAELAGWLHVMDATDCDNVLFAGDAKLDEGRTTGRFNWLGKQVKAFGADVLIFDNASDAMDANENDRAKVRQFMSVLKRLASAVLLLAHVDAASSMADASEAKGYSGSTGWHNSARSRWFMSRVKDSDDIVLALPKVNYAKAGAEALIRWSETTHVFEVISTQQGPAKAKNNRAVLLGLLQRAIDTGARVSMSAAPATSVFNTIKDMDGFPRGLASKDVATEVKRWVADGLVMAVGYTTPQRKSGECMVLTELGKHVCDAGDADEGATDCDLV